MARIRTFEFSNAAKKISKNEDRDNHSVVIGKKYLKIQNLMNLLDLCTLVRDGRVCALKFIEIRPIIGTTRYTFSIVFFYFFDLTTSLCEQVKSWVLCIV